MGTPISRDTFYREATIANGASQSDIIDIKDGAILVIECPAAWTAASLTFLGSQDGTTFGPVYGDDGTEVTIASANVVALRVLVNKAVIEQLAGIRFLRIRSGTAGAPVNQGAARVFKLTAKG
jgi:hypothetical protein